MTQVATTGTRSGLIHEAATKVDERTESQDVVWCDLPGYRIRHLYVEGLRRQHVRIVVRRANRSAPALPAPPRLWTRAERAHRRLSWAARLTRNRCAAGPPRYAYLVFGVAPALATYLGVAPDPPG